MGNFRITEEAMAPSGWKICCIFNQARNMSDQEKDVNDALVDFFEDIEFAASSEYKMENLKKKLAKDCLIFFDRIDVAGAGHVMPRCRTDLSPRNTLDQLSKMVKISQAPVPLPAR